MYNILQVYRQKNIIICGTYKTKRNIHMAKDSIFTGAIHVVP